MSTSRRLFIKLSVRFLASWGYITLSGVSVLTLSSLSYLSFHTRKAHSEMTILRRRVAGRIFPFSVLLSRRGRAMTVVMSRSGGQSIFFLVQIASAMCGGVSIGNSSHLLRNLFCS